MKQLDYLVKASEENERLDKLLVTLNRDFSRQQIQTMIKEGLVTVNTKKEKANYRCKENDLIEWTIKEATVREIKAENIPLDILYEDDFLLVINKPKGMLVHPTVTVQSNTLVNALKYHAGALSTIGGEDRPGIVHRLDQHTSGLIVCCKDNATHLHLKDQFKHQSVKRIYEAIVYGDLPHEKGIIQAPIGRDQKNRLKMAVVSGGKEAETRFQVLERFFDYTHVECQLITGRTHQIRVHLNYIKHPIVGDELYSHKKSKLIEHQALFAKTLGFIHPHTKTYVEFSVNQPDDFKKLLQICRSNA